MTGFDRFMPLYAGKCRKVPFSAGFCRKMPVLDVNNLESTALNPRFYKVHVGKMSTKGLLSVDKHWGFVGEMSEKSRRVVGEGLTFTGFVSVKL
ncbi:hypothetical protein [Chitinophaga skermanii]|uniref:hypothetical protein n=1 Tax=Chitinophaga skermanii TaxID=331697 RepID=UPI0011E5A003|nr:hypothetical protein [Chitinophaga skermanii]